MSVDIYTSTAADAISAQELELYNLIMEYRAEQGLDPIPLSAALSATAGRHALDTTENIWAENLDLPSGANLHSWSDAPYYSDHRDPAIMWGAPGRLGLDYPSAGYEISAAGYEDVAAALDGWKGSSGHNTVIVNAGDWAQVDWGAIGVGVEENGAGPFGGRIYHVWFGEDADPNGAPEIEGGTSADTFDGTGFDDVLRPGDGDDTVRAGDGDDDVEGGAGADRMFLGAGDDTGAGGTGDDILGGADGRDALSGGTGDDTLFGGAGNDTLEGGAGRDVIWAGSGDDIITADVVGGQSDTSDAILGGGEGEDTITGAQGNDTVYGGRDGGGDTINTQGGRDIAFSGAGNDAVDGGAGNDTIFGGAGDDTLWGSSGDDEIWGGTGSDEMSGGTGADTFGFIAGSGADTIEGFSVAEDRLDLRGYDGLSTSTVLSGAQDVSGGVLLTLGGGDTILLEGVAQADLDIGLFV